MRTRFVLLVLILGVQSFGSSRWVLAQEPVVVPSSRQARPSDCAQVDRLGQKPSFWDRARLGVLGTYCSLVARASVRTDSEPAVALELAAAAERVLPSHASVPVVRARAYLSLRDSKQAIVWFERALALNSASLDAPMVRRDYALALRRERRLDEALKQYDILATQLPFVRDASERTRVVLEVAALRVSAGPTRLDDAVALLRQTRTFQPGPLHDHAIALQALCLDRLGKSHVAQKIVSEHFESRSPRELAAVDDYLVDPSERHALLAVLSPTPEAAAVHWEAYLKTATQPAYVEHARAAMLRRAKR